MTAKIHIILFLGLYFVALFLGCVASEPNVPYQGPYPPGVNEIAYKNPLLMEELAKLPELQDGISDEEAVALNTILKRYNNDPVTFETAFNEMYKIGIPQVRRYCSPLQALFWLAEDNELRDEHIAKYSLTSLLSQAWEEGQLLTDQQAMEVINGIRDDKVKHQFLQYAQNGVDEATVNTIMVNYKSRPQMFSWSARRIIKSASTSDPRWDDIDAIIERLNAPELFDFYINKNITYAHHVPGYHRPPSSVIKEKYGDCDDVAYFGKIVLKKAGYDVFGRSFDLGSWPNHIGLGVKLNDGTYLLAVHFNQTGNHMGGPYKTVLELDQALGYGSIYQTRDSFHFDW